jgi:inner membrane protein
MDTITQGLLGAAVGQIGFRSRIGRDASWVAALAAASPDLDIFTPRILAWLGRPDDLASMLYHRGLTHSLLMIAAIALLFALPWYGIRKLLARRKAKSPTQEHAPPTGEAAALTAPGGAPAPSGKLHLATDTPGGAPAPPGSQNLPGFGWFFGCCLAAVATHGLLDACTSYGTQLLSPILFGRAAWDMVPIVDIIYTPLLIVTLLSCFVLRRLKLRRHRAASIVAAVGLLLSTGYLITGRVLHDRAVALARHNAAGREILAVDAYPMVPTIFVWRTVVETPDEWIVARVHQFNGGPDEPQVVARHPASQAIRAARQTRHWQVFHWFAGGKLRAVSRPVQGGTLIDFHDMRYGWPSDATESLWAMRIFVPTDSPAQALGRVRNPGRNDRRKMLAMLWRDLWNP